MKRYSLLLLVLSLLVSKSLYAEDAASQTQAEPVQSAPVVTQDQAPAPETSNPTVDTTVQEAQAIATVPASAASTTPVVSAEPTSVEGTGGENLEFVSGEVTSVDEATKALTVKLYGEADGGANDKILSVKLDENTDITDGEKDRDLKSLTTGTEVDVEYDAKSSKATYIFVY